MHDSILDALRRGAHAEALDAARAAVAADPADARALELMAMAQRAAGDTAGALDSLDRAIALKPDEAGLHFQRAALQIGHRDIDGAQASLARTLALDPNSFGAYVIQAELAIGRGDVDEAERLATLAARIDEAHPALASVRGMIALRRGDHDRAQSILGAAVQADPNNPQLLNALAFAYLAKDHLAFAEQALLRLVALTPANHGARRLLADVVHRQGRAAEAAAHLQPALAVASPAPEHLRFAGALALEQGQPVDAIARLKTVLAHTPGDAQTLGLLLRAWQMVGDADDARATLEAALATTVDLPQLWQTRVALEPAGEAAQAVLTRWRAAMPDTVPLLQAEFEHARALGHQDDAIATARTIAARVPDNMLAHTQLLDVLADRDPEQAVAYLRELEEAGDTADGGRARMIQGWMSMALDRAGRTDEAAAAWTRMHADWAERLLPLPAWTDPDAARAERAPAPESSRALMFLAGLPGSGHEHAGRLLDGALPDFRADRMGANPPRDALQKLTVFDALARNDTTPEAVYQDWAGQLAARGSEGRALIDWLLWWDNALLDVLHAHLPDARVALIIRDPRDMLLNWLAFGTPVPFRLGTPDEGAQWLARGLEHVLALPGLTAQPVHVVRVDDTVNDPAAMAVQLGEVLGVTLPVPPRNLFQGHRFPAGRWRDYADALAGPFATLTPVAVRLGYPED